MTQVMIDHPMPRSAASPAEHIGEQAAETLERPRRVRLVRSVGPAHAYVVRDGRTCRARCLRAPYGLEAAEVFDTDR